MTDLHFCGRCLAMQDQAAALDQRWPESSLLWHLAGTVPGIALEALAEVVQQACLAWTRHCRLAMTRTQESNLAHIRMAVGKIDGPRGILGQSELPPARPVRQWYDQAEDWLREISPLAVITHELGHALGLEHDPAPGALMSAYYDRNIQAPTSRDIVRIQALYGRADPPPTPSWPPPLPPLPGEEAITITLYPAAKQFALPAGWSPRS